MIWGFIVSEIILEFREACDDLKSLGVLSSTKWTDKGKTCAFLRRLFFFQWRIFRISQPIDNHWFFSFLIQVNNTFLCCVFRNSVTRHVQVIWHKLQSYSVQTLNGVNNIKGHHIGNVLKKESLSKSSKLFIFKSMQGKRIFLPR